MKQINYILSFLLLVFAFTPAYSGQVIDSDSYTDKRGSTTAAGTYNLIQVSEKKVRLDLNLRVKKTGISGTGRGVMGFALIDDSGKPLVNKKIGVSVGAHAIKGVARKEVKRSFTFFGNKAKRIIDGDISEIAFMVDATKDSTGLCTTKKCWEEALESATWIIKAYSSIP